MVIVTPQAVKSAICGESGDAPQAVKSAFYGKSGNQYGFLQSSQYLADQRAMMSRGSEEEDTSIHDTEEREEAEDTKLNVNAGIYIYRGTGELVASNVQDVPDAPVGDYHVGTGGALHYKLDPQGNGYLKPVRVNTSSILLRKEDTGDSFNLWTPNYLGCSLKSYLRIDTRIGGRMPIKLIQRPIFVRVSGTVGLLALWHGLIVRKEGQIIRG